MAETDVAELVAGVCARDDSTIARALALIESTHASLRDAQRELLRELERCTPDAHALVGITGPPGAGKSSLCGELMRHWIEGGAGVGMLAVDPTSRRSGGALLGDRARLRLDPGGSFFVRSMAARERLGGLAPATRAGAAVLRAAYPWTLIETVGVGQSEVDVASLAGTVVLVLQPGSGDTLQFMKAGILEIPDVLVVHKWDLGALAERTRADLESLLGMIAPGRAGWSPPVLGASAQTGHGVPELALQIERHREHLERSGEGIRRRADARGAWLLEMIEERWGSWGIERLGGRAALLEASRGLDGGPLDAVELLRTRGGLEP